MYLYRKKITESCLVLFSPLLYSLNVWCLLQIYNERMERCHTEGSHGLSFSIYLILFFNFTIIYPYFTIKQLLTLFIICILAY